MATGGCIWWSNIEPFQRSPTGIWDAILAFSTGHVIILWKLVWNRKWAIFAIIVDRSGHEIWKMSHFGLCTKNGKWAIFAIFVDQSGHEIWQISHFDPWWYSESESSSSESSDRFLKSGLLGILATARDNWWHLIKIDNGSQMVGEVKNIRIQTSISGYSHNNINDRTLGSHRAKKGDYIIIILHHHSHHLMNIPRKRPSQVLALEEFGTSQKWRKIYAWQWPMYDDVRRQKWVRLVLP